MGQPAYTVASAVPDSSHATCAAVSRMSKRV
jgi:hypothetical protein